MIGRFRANCPDAHAKCAKIQESDFFNTTFDAVVAWGVLLHLARPDQVQTVAKVSGILRPGGRFLFTGGDQDGIAESEMDSVRFRYVSLGAICYRKLLRDHGFAVLDEHRDAWDNYVFIAEKRASHS